MDDLELYIYIALAVIYFLSRAFRKKKQVKPPASTQSTSSSHDYEDSPKKEKPLIFEDLLKEFTGKKDVPVYEEEEEFIEVEEENTADRKYVKEIDQFVDEYDTNHEDNYKSYQDPYPNKGNLKTLDEQVQIKTAPSKRFDAYKIEKNVNIHTAKRFRKLLKNKDSVKDAIIFKEIFDRKYF
jgi:hypothetical protein